MINGFGRSVEKKELKKANKIATKVQSIYEQKYSNMTLEELILEQSNIKDMKKEEERDVNALALFKQISYLTTGLKPFFVTRCCCLCS